MQHEDESIWPIDIGKLTTHPDGVVLVYGEVGNKSRFYQEAGRHNIPDQCLFVLGRSPSPFDKSRLGDILRDYLLEWNIYDTVRHEWSVRETHNWGRDHRNTSLEYTKVSERVFVNLTKWRSALGFQPLDDPPLPRRADLDVYTDRYGHSLFVAGFDPAWVKQQKMRIEVQKKQRRQGYKDIYPLSDTSKKNPSAQTPGNNERSETLSSHPEPDTSIHPSKKQKIVIEID